LLKAKRPAHINVWDNELVYYGTIVNNFRQLYLQKFKPIFIEIINQFLEIDDTEIKLISGWDTSIEF
jgi:DNA replication and repair protein RecF